MKHFKTEDPKLNQLETEAHPYSRFAYAANSDNTASAKNKGFKPAFANEPESNGFKHRKPKNSLLALIIAIVVVAICVVIYLGGVVYFYSHFGLNTTIDGRNMSLLKVDQVEATLVDNYSDAFFLITGREDLELVIPAEQLNLHYEPDEQIGDLLSAQNPWAWPARILPQDATATKASFTYDQSDLNQVLDGLTIFDPKTMRAPTDAVVVFENGGYVVKGEDMGTTIDVQLARAAIKAALDNGELTCDLDLAKCYVDPSVRAEDPNLQNRIADFNLYAPFEIVYTFGDETETLDANTALQWFTTNADGTKKLDVKALQAWLAEFADRHDTVGAERPFTTTSGKTITVSGGSYGWSINENAERDAIIAAIANQSSETREPIYIQSAVNHSMPDFGNTYVEVDQSMQHMWYYVNGKLTLESDVVTGLPTPKRSTPNGVYYVISKKTPAKLRGPMMPNGEYEWESTVTFWMQVTSGGVGFHDAYWQSSFGLQRWQDGFGSHGCINLPYDKAKELYSILEVGTPVIIHN
jgi:hypothetical protein